MVCRLYFTHNLHFFSRTAVCSPHSSSSLTGCSIKRAGLFHRNCGKNNFGNQAGAHLIEGDYQSFIIVFFVFVSLKNSWFVFKFVPVLFTQLTSRRRRCFKTKRLLSFSIFYIVAVF